MENSLKTLLSLMCFLSHSLHSHAEVIGLGNHKKILSFERHLHKSVNLTSLRSAFLNKELKKSEHLIKSKYELAVKGLLLEDLKPSIFVLKEITSFQKKSLLSSVAADLVSQSHMRLAHLDQENSNFWIKHVLFFNPSYKPEAGQFNPVVSSLLEDNRGRISPYLYELSKKSIADNDTIVFVNGVQMLSSTLVHPSGEFTFTFFKHGHAKKTIDLRGEDLTKLDQVKLAPLSLGSCESPKFKTQYGIQIEKIFFSKDCIRSIQDFQSSELIKSGPIPSVARADSMSKSQKKSVKPHKKGLFNRKSTWYVIGAAIASGVLVASLSSQSGTTTVVPTER